MNIEVGGGSIENIRRQNVTHFFKKLLCFRNVLIVILAPILLSPLLFLGANDDVRVSQETKSQMEKYSLLT